LDDEVAATPPKITLIVPWAAEIGWDYPDHLDLYCFYVSHSASPELFWLLKQNHASQAKNIALPSACL
jgi:hypothetical protein